MPKVDPDQDPLATQAVTTQTILNNEEIGSRDDELLSALTRAGDVIGDLKTRRISAMDMAILRKSQNKFILGFSEEEVAAIFGHPPKDMLPTDEKYFESFEGGDYSLLLNFTPDVGQIIWLLKADDEDYAKAAVDNEWFKSRAIIRARTLSLYDVTVMVPGITAVITEIRRVQVKPAPSDEPAGSGAPSKKD